MDKAAGDGETRQGAILCSVTFTKFYLAVKIKKNEIGWARSPYEGQERCIHLLVGKLEGKRPFARPRRRWEENIKMYLQDVGCGHGLV